MKAVVAGLGALLAFASAASAEMAFGITGASAGGTLIRFDTASPGGATSVGALTGIPSGFSVRAIDFRPSTGELYTVATNSTNGGRLFKINTATGALTAVGAGFTFASNVDSRVSMDFDPTTDQIRVVSANDQSLRVNPVTGGLIAQDPNISPTSVFQGDIAINNTGTIFLYDFGDESTNTLNGTTGAVSFLNPVSGIFTWDAGIGFDISPVTGAAFLSYQASDSVYSAGFAETLASVNLGTGTVTPIGAFGGGFNVLDIAVVPAPSAIGLLAIAGFGAARRRRT
jgi:hypothetical protein